MTERLPPPDVSRFPRLRAEHLREIGADVPLGRIYFAAGEFPTSWNSFRTRSRFDHHPRKRGVHPRHGVMYLAPALVDARGVTMSALRSRDMPAPYKPPILPPSPRHKLLLAVSSCVGCTSRCCWPNQVVLGRDATWDRACG